MTCALCGGGDRWIKNCIKVEDRAPGWDWWPRSFRCCDPCYESRRPELLIVPGPFSVTAKCTRCGVFGNPRDFTDLRSAYWKEAYGGTCTMCAR